MNVTEQDKPIGLQGAEVLLDIFKQGLKNVQSGAQGVSISKIEQTTTSAADGGENLITVTLSDGTVSTFYIKNGSKGEPGKNGINGTNGTTPTINAAAGANIGVVGTPSVTATTDGTTTTFTFNHLKGKQGDKGDAGIRGSAIYWGTGVTGTSTTATVFSGSGVTSALVNDLYLNTSLWNIYQCTVAGAASVAKWVYKGNIKGDPGTNGTNATTTAVVSTTANGLAPKCGGTTTKFLRDDGTWATPPDTNTTYGNASASAAGLVSTAAQTFAGAKTFNGSIYASGATAAGTQQCRNLAVGTAAATASNCPSGCWYGQYS